MSETIEVVRGDSLSFIVALDVDGDPFDWVGWGAVAQVRKSPDAAALLALTITVDGLPAGSARFSLTAAQTAGLRGEYVWDVQMVDPEAVEGGGVVTWPPASEDRHRLVVVADVTRVVGVGS